MGIKKKTCKYSFSDEEETIAISGLEYASYPIVSPPPPPPPPPLSPFILDERIQIKTNYIKPLKKLSKKNKINPDTPPLFKTKNGDFPFQENGKWGLKNKNKINIIAPIFDQIFGDYTGKHSSSNGNGVIACNTGRCNYYLSGKPILEKDWYYISVINDSTFYVSDTTGYGVISNNKMIIKPIHKNYYNIKKNCYDDYCAFFIHDKETGTTTVTIDNNEIYKANTILEEVGYLDEDYILLEGKLINRKTKELLICDENYRIALFDTKEKLFLLRDLTNENTYLIDSRGNMKFTNPYKNIKKYNEDYYEVEQSSTTGMRKPLKGLINETGKIVVPIRYEAIVVLGDYFAVLQPLSYNWSILDKKGKQLIPFKNFRPHSIQSDTFLLVEIPSREYSKIVLLPEGEILDTVSYAYITKANLCNKKFYLGGQVWGGKRAFYFDENLNPIGDPNFAIKIIDRNRRYSIYAKDDRKKNGIKCYDCNENPIILNIEGKSIDVFKDIFFISKGLHGVWLQSGEFYLLKNGKEVIKPDFDLLKHQTISSTNFIKVQDKETKRWGLWDKKGNQLLPPIYKNIFGNHPATEYVHVILEDDSVKFLNRNGQFILQKIDNVTKYLGYGLFQIEENEKFGIVNNQGQIIFQPIFEKCWLSAGLIYRQNGQIIKKSTLEGEAL